MTIIPLKALTYNDTNLQDDTTPQWDIMAGYLLGTIRQLNNKLYESLADILPLADYWYSDIDPLRPHQTYNIATEEIQTPTSIICVLNETIVYVEDLNAYYVFDKTGGFATDNGDGTYTVDFTQQDKNNPANFTLTSGYRNVVNNPEATPLIWQDNGYTNKYKLLDSSLNSITEYNGDMYLEFIVNKIDSVFLFNLYASSVNITVTSPDESVEYYNETTSTFSKNGGTFYDYFLNDFTYNNKIFANVPIYIQVKVKITLYGVGGVSKCGLVAIGKEQYIGGTLYGASVSSRDFSKKIENTNGEIYLEKGNVKRTNNVTIDVPSGLTDTVVDFLDSITATPVIFKASDIYKTTILFGTYNKYDVLLSTQSISRMSLDYESLI